MVPASILSEARKSANSNGLIRLILSTRIAVFPQTGCRVPPQGNERLTHGNQATELPISRQITCFGKQVMSISQKTSASVMRTTCGVPRHAEQGQTRSHFGECLQDTFDDCDDAITGGRRSKLGAGVAGVSGGTSLLALINSLPDTNHWKPLLMFASPTVAVAIGWVWLLAMKRLDNWIAERSLEL